MTTRAKKFSLWPSLRFERLGRLDWDVMPYEPQRLAGLGRELQSMPQRPLDWAIGQLLRDLAQTPAALKALNRIPKTAPRDTRGLNVAVHYLALTRLKDASAVAQPTVATSWGIRAATVQELYREFSERAAIELDALVEICIARGRPHKKPKDVLRDVDADMRARADMDCFQMKAARAR